MIVQEFYKQRADGVKLYKTYSDANVKIKQEQTNKIYVIAIDVESAPYTYIETEIPIPTPPTPPTPIIDESIATDSDYETALNKLGVDFNAET